MKNAKFILIGVSLVIILGNITIIDFADLSWAKNSGSYLGILAMLLLIIVLVITLLEKKNKT